MFGFEYRFTFYDASSIIIETICLACRQPNVHMYKAGCLIGAHVWGYVIIV